MVLEHYHVIRIGNSNFRVFAFVNFLYQNIFQKLDGRFMRSIRSAVNYLVRSISDDPDRFIIIGVDRDSDKTFVRGSPRGAGGLNEYVHFFKQMSRNGKNRTGNVYAQI